MQPRRYVILHHTGIDRPHFDFCFEIEPDAAALTTLRCPQWPIALGDAVEELPEHRRAYLDYEGPVSNDRGAVKRIEAGEIDVADLAADPPTLGLRLRPAGPGVRIEMTLTQSYVEDARSMWTVVTLTGA